MPICYSCDIYLAVIVILLTFLKLSWISMQVLDFLSYSSLVLVDEVNIWLLESFPPDY